jgi:hypothetical protein
MNRTQRETDCTAVIKAGKAAPVGGLFSFSSRRTMAPIGATRRFVAMQDLVAIRA